MLSPSIHSACPTLIQCLKDCAAHESAASAADDSASGDASAGAAEGASPHAAACAAEAEVDPETIVAGEEPETAAAPSSSAPAAGERAAR